MWEEDGDGGGTEEEEKRHGGRWYEFGVPRAHVELGVKQPPFQVKTFHFLHRISFFLEILGVKYFEIQVGGFGLHYM